MFDLFEYKYLYLRNIALADIKVAKYTPRVVSHEVPGILPNLNVLPERELLPEAAHGEGGGGGVVGGVWLYHSQPEGGVPGGQPVGGGGAHDPSAHNENIVVVTASVNTKPRH